ncbi:MAG: ABC transporter permease [Melioribacteraceae bacterium]|nr:ABC transporter permease [Melioribacteraceae bacterium]
MQIYESILMALQSIVNNKLRSALTLLGITIGLFSIIIVMTSITAIQSSFEDVFSSIGANNFYIQKYPAVRIGHGSWRKYRNRKDLSIDQAERLKDMTTLPKAIGVFLNNSSRTIKYKDKNTNPDVTLSGMNLDGLIVSDYNVEHGRGFTYQDMLYGRNVCILGVDVANKLFPSLYPIGEQVRVDNMNLTVIGIFEKQGSVLGQGQDNFLTIPISVYEKYYGDNSSATYGIMTNSKEDFEKTMDQVIGALRIIRKVPLGSDNDFESVTNDQLIEQFNDITKYFKVGAGVIAFIALIAAGVGIMNIMLVNVTERTKEIGIRKSIGARKSVIRSQFVAEAVVLSQVGGLLGIVLGVIGGNIVALTMNVNVVLPFSWIIIGLVLTTAVGVIFGVYPAIKASNLDPIDALRYE